MRKVLFHPITISILLFVQIVPLIIFPIEVFDPKSQQWWLPLLLAVLAFIAAVQIVVFNSLTSTPWTLTSFAQGFNIISRLMMLLPGSSSMGSGELVFNIPYITINIAAMLLSALWIWYTSLPEVQTALIRRAAEKVK